MPVCTVVGCCNGFNKTKKRPNPENHQSFKIPTFQVALRKRWLEKINRKNFNPANGYVCIKHFKEEDFKFKVGDKDLRGRLRTTCKLKDNAVPSLYLRGIVPVVQSTGAIRANGKSHQNPLPLTVYASQALIEHDHSYVLMHNPTHLQPQPIDYNNPMPENDAAQEEVLMEIEQQAMDHEGMDYASEVNITDTKVTNLEITIQEDQALTLANYKQILAEKEKENELLRKENSKQKAKIDSMAKIFQPDQLYRAQYPNTRFAWSDFTLQKIMQMYFACGKKGYNFLYDNVLPNLIPERTTIVRHCNTIESTWGTQYDMIKLMAMKFETMPKRDRKCAIILDEMSISPKREYDPSTGEFIGLPTLPAGPALLEKRRKEGIDNSKVLATHVLNILCVGLVKFWKQLVGYHLTDESFCPKAGAKWLREVLSLLFGIGLEVMLIIHDMGSCMIGL